MTADGGFLNVLAGGWLTWMAHMTWQVALLAAVVWLVALLSGRSSAAFRYTLWLLVFVKLLLPPGLGAPWSLGTAATRLRPIVQPIVGSEQPLRIGGFEIRPLKEGSTTTGDPRGGFEALDGPPAARRHMSLRPAGLLMGLWAVVAIGLFAAMLTQYVRYARRVMKQLSPPPRAIVEGITAQAERLGMHGPVDVKLSPHVCTPAVFGTWRPTVLLPQDCAERFSQQELRNVIGHELAHVKRKDVLVGWGVSLLLCLYWFHPAVWMVNLYLRREREMACDDMVLYAIRQESKDYAATIVRVAESFEGGVPVGAGFLGLLEVADNLLQRIRSVSDATRSRRLGWRSAATLLLVVVLFVPMGMWSSASLAQETISAGVDEEIEQHYAKADPDVQEYIRWTARTFSPRGLWLAENAFADLMPEEREQKVAYYAQALQGEYGRHLCDALAAAGPLKDERLLPGLVKVASYHRDDGDYDCRPKWMAVAALGRMDDESAIPVLIRLVDHGNQNTRMWARASLARITGEYFGADKSAWVEWWNKTGKEPQISAAELEAWSRPPDSIKSLSQVPPKVQSSQPKNGATDVDPALAQIRVSFDQDMETRGYSWTGGPRYYPETTGRPQWVDKRTCILPVKFRPARYYRVGINSKSYKNFRGINGVPVQPQVIAFTTKGADEAMVAGLKAPKVVKMTPENGATNVSPALEEMNVAFDQSMGLGFAWTERDGIPYPQPSALPYWSEDGMTCTLPVRLKPSSTYTIGLNGPNENDFQSAYGVPLEPVVWTFSTGE